MKKPTKHFIIIMLLATLTTGLVATGAIGLYNAIAGDSSSPSTSSNQSYTITLNPHGGELSQSSMTLNAGQPFGPLPTPIKLGYTFTGWFSEESYTNKIEKLRYLTT